MAFTLPLRERFRNLTRDEYTQRWNDLWIEGATSWDRGQPSPVLFDLFSGVYPEIKGYLARDPALVPEAGRQMRKALVPGCGRGYDVLLLAAFGYDAYGLEVSQKALEAAREYEQIHRGDEIYQGHEDPFNPGKKYDKGTVTWLAGDFFKNDFLKNFESEEGTFDLIFDYTFLSALPVDMRAAWAKRFSVLLSPTGIAVCVEWPSLKSVKTGGPPWALPPKVYLSHLSRPGQELPYDFDDLLEHMLGPESKDGLECVWRVQPKRTHAAGIDGNGRVTDWLSLWRHKTAAELV